MNKVDFLIPKTNNIGYCEFFKEPERLLLIPPAKKNESLSSYLIRLAEENHYEKLVWIYNLIGLQLRPYSVFHFSEKSVSLLSKLTGESTENLRGLSYHDYGQLNTSISLKRTKICPKCFSEDLYHRKYWDISVNVCCSVHNCLLINTCPSCNGGLIYSRNQMDKCKCGFHLMDLPQINIDKRIAQISSLFEQGINDKSTMIKDLFGNISYPNLIRAFHLFSRSISLFINKMEVDYNSDTQDPLFLSILLETYQIFLDWPNNFFRFLDIYREEPKFNRKLGLLRDYGNFYVSLRENFNSNDFEFINSSFGDYLSSRWQSGYKNKIKNNQFDLKETKYLSGAEAAKLLSSTQELICKLIEAKLIKGSIEKHKRFRQVSVELKSLTAYQAYIKDFVPFQTAKNIIGLSDVSLKLLLDEDLIHSLNYKDFLHVLVSRRGLTSLLNLMEEKLSLLSNNSTSYISFVKCLDIAKGYNCSILEIVQFIQEGLLKPRERNEKEKGLRAYLFLKDEVKEAFLKHKLSNPHLKWLNAKDISQIIPSTQKIIRYWLKLGFFGGAVKITNTLVVSYNDVQSFLDEYTFLNKIKTDFNLSSSYQKLFNTLAANGYTPINLNGGTLGRYIYRSSEIEKYILRNTHEFID